MTTTVGTSTSTVKPTHQALPDPTPHPSLRDQLQAAAALLDRDTALAGDELATARDAIDQALIELRRLSSKSDEADVDDCNERALAEGATEDEEPEDARDLLTRWRTRGARERLKVAVDALQSTFERTEDGGDVNRMAAALELVEHAHQELDVRLDEVLETLDAAHQREQQLAARRCAVDGVDVVAQILPPGFSVTALIVDPTHARAWWAAGADPLKVLGQRVKQAAAATDLAGVREALDPRVQQLADALTTGDMIDADGKKPPASAAAGDGGDGDLVAGIVRARADVFELNAQVAELADLIDVLANDVGGLDEDTDAARLRRLAVVARRCNSDATEAAEAMERLDVLLAELARPLASTSASRSK